MAIIPLKNADGSPNVAAMFAASAIISGLYHQTTAQAQAYGQDVAATVLGSRINPATYEPDYVVLGDGDSALVVFAGTTNAPQWLGHAGSALVPVADEVSGGETLASFYYGLRIREPEIMALLAPYRGRTIWITGHSYGGAAANILARHLRTGDAGAYIGVLTFGEPKSYVASVAPDYYNWKARIVAVDHSEGGISRDVGARDPVTMMPPAQLEFCFGGIWAAVAKAVTGLSYTHKGDEWLLPETGKLHGPFSYSPLAYIPFVELVATIGQVVGHVYLHFQDTSYLPKTRAAFFAAGPPAILQNLANSILPFIASPAQFPEVTGPPIPNDTINAGWGLPPSTVNGANRTEWATVSGSATVEKTVEVSTMPATYIQPVFKGTYHFSQDNEGTSESYYYTGNPTGFGYSSMLALMKTLWPYRSQLSMSSDNVNCGNPLNLLAITVENELTFRDAVTTSAAALKGQSFISVNGPVNSGTELTAAFGNNTYSNDNADAAWKAQFLDGNGHEAQQYFHGVPLYSQYTTVGGISVNVVNNQPTTIQTNQGQRLTQPNSAYVKAMQNFCNQLVALGLGFRYTWHIWEPQGIKTPDYPTGAPGTPGNSTPTGVYYNLPGYPVNCYTFTMPQSTLGTSLVPFVEINTKGRYRVIVRGCVALRPINGRWPAIGWTSQGPPSGFTGPFPAAGQNCLTVIHRAADYAWDGQGDVCPEAWSAMIPLPAVPPAGSVNPPGVANIILTSKKTGRPFDLQRGRSRNRAT